MSECRNVYADKIDILIVNANNEYSCHPMYVCDGDMALLATQPQPPPNTIHTHTPYITHHDRLPQIKMSLKCFDDCILINIEWSNLA